MKIAAFDALFEKGLFILITKVIYFMLPWYKKLDLIPTTFSIVDPI